MSKKQHSALARHYQSRYAAMAEHSRLAHGKLTHQQALDYAAMWAKYTKHKRASEFQL